LSGMASQTHDSRHAYEGIRSHSNCQGASEDRSIDLR